MAPRSAALARREHVEAVGLEQLRVHGRPAIVGHQRPVARRAFLVAEPVGAHVRRVPRSPGVRPRSGSGRRKPCTNHRRSRCPASKRSCRSLCWNRRSLRMAASTFARASCCYAGGISTTAARIQLREGLRGGLLHATVRIVDQVSQAAAHVHRRNGAHLQVGAVRSGNAQRLRAWPSTPCRPPAMPPSRRLRQVRLAHLDLDALARCFAGAFGDHLHLADADALGDLHAEGDPPDRPAR